MKNRNKKDDLNADTWELERKINKFVYKLYRLNKKEIEIIKAVDKNNNGK